jgi:hypothetical protein
MTTRNRWPLPAMRLTLPHRAADNEYQPLIACRAIPIDQPQVLALSEGVLQDSNLPPQTCEEDPDPPLTR